MLLAVRPARRTEDDCSTTPGGGNPDPVSMTLGASQEARYRPLLWNTPKLPQTSLGLIEGQSVEAIKALPLVDATGRCNDAIRMSPPFASIPPGAASVACAGEGVPVELPQA